MLLVRLAILFGAPLLVGATVAVLRRRTADAAAPAVVLSGTWLLYAALAVQVLRIQSVPSAQVLVGGGTGMRGLAIVTVLVAAWLGLNAWRSRGTRMPIALVLAGLNANLVAILANGGDMPYSAAAARLAGVEGDANVVVSTSITPATHLVALTDVIPVPALVISVGDVLIMAGIAILGFRLLQAPLAARGERAAAQAGASHRTA